MDFLTMMKEQAKNNLQTIVLPEGSEKRTVIAAAQILKEGLAKLILLGKKDEILSMANEQGVDLSGATLIEPEKDEHYEEYCKKFYEMRKSKGVTEEAAHETMKDEIYFGTMMVNEGLAGGLVSGAIHSTGDTMRPALQILKTSPGTKYVSSFMVMVVPDCDLGDNGTFIFSDPAITPNPDADNLAEIAISAANSYLSLFPDKTPRVAMLSYSTYGSAKGEIVEKVQQAVKIAKERAPQINLDGEMQADAALVEAVGKLKAPTSPVAGNANVLIFPDLNAANIGYKLVERLAKAKAYGPVLQGIKKPVNDLSRGCSSDDIVGVVAITAVQVQNAK